MSVKLVLPVLPPSPRELKLAEEARAKAKMRRLQRCVERYEGHRYGSYYWKSIVRFLSWIFIMIILWFGSLILLNQAFGRPSIYIITFIQAFFTFMFQAPFLCRFVSVMIQLRKNSYKDPLSASEAEIVIRLCYSFRSGTPFGPKLPRAEDVLNTPSSPLVSPVSFVRLLRQYNRIEPRRRARKTLRR